MSPVVSFVCTVSQISLRKQNKTKRKKETNFVRAYFLRLRSCFSSLQWINFNYGINTNKRHTFSIDSRRRSCRLGTVRKRRFLLRFEHFHLIAYDVQWVAQMNCRRIAMRKKSVNSYDGCWWSNTLQMTMTALFQHELDLFPLLSSSSRLVDDVKASDAFNIASAIMHQWR